MSEQAKLRYDGTYQSAQIQKAQNGDSAALEDLMKDNRPLVISIVRRYLNFNESFEDLVQIGNIGLLKAIKKFDVSYDTRFSTYAVYLIAGEIKKYFRDTGYLKIGRKLKEIYIKAKIARGELLKKNGSEPSLKEIADFLSVDETVLSEAVSACSMPEYLQKDIYDDEGKANSRRLGDTISDEKYKPDNNVERMDLKNIISELSKDERQIVMLRYFDRLTQKKVGEIMNKSQVQISRMEKKIIERIKVKMT